MLNLRITNPARPVNWRWLRAKTLFESESATSIRCDDALTARALRFVRRHARCDMENQFRALLNADPDFFEAWNLYDEITVAPFRFEIEARVLADEPRPQIAAKTGITVKTIELFESCFFDVRARLGTQSYIQQCVLQPSAAAGLKNRGHDLKWKLYGYCGGPHVLDSIINGCVKPTKPNSPAGVAAFWQDDIADSVRQKAAIAMRSMPIDSQTRNEILDVYQRMLELERTAGEGTVVRDTVRASCFRAGSSRRG